MGYVILGILALIALFALLVGAFKLFFTYVQPSDKVRQKHQGKEEADSVFMKKYPEADVNNYWWTFFLTGSMISLAIVITAFEWTTYNKVTKDLGEVKKMDQFEVEPPQTKRKQKPPPPPPPPKIKEVEDDKILEDEPEIQDIDIEEEQAVDIPEAPAQEEETDEQKVFKIVEDMPKFPGGQKELQKYLAQIKYPPIAKENDIEGKIYVRFVIDKQGNVTNVSVARGSEKILNEAAVKHVQNMPKWQPGKQRGEKVKVQYVVPISFQLQ
ncbi:MAG: energy transducer TonB [Bacteroidetes bacterium SW_11_45_7]|nr:MAG: energy transducer TonB [Bacteroidetes bacterium SW_11_45_7]